MLNLLVEPIRADLALTDTSISFIQGLAFVIPYVVMSIPLGRLVDKFNRIAVLIGGVLVWSVTTFSCGLANSYVKLLCARMGVGAGEASVTPASWSLLADYFPPERLARPVSVFLMGPYLGAGIAMIAGAAIIEWAAKTPEIVVPVWGAIAPWQLTFMLVAAPGILVALLLGTLYNPPRKSHSAQQGSAHWREVFDYVVRHRRIYAAVLLGVPFIVIILYALQAWTPTLLLRVYDWNIASAGRIYGTTALVCGSAGVLTGPVIARTLAARGYDDYPLRLAAWASAGIMISIIGLPWQSNAVGALLCIGCASFFVTLPLALITYTLQTVTPNEMRGVIAGVYVVSTNIIGLGLGPTLVAAVTDYFFADPDRVADALTIVCVVVAPIAMLLLISGMHALGTWRRQLAH